MARMYPNQVDPTTKSDAERTLHAAFRDQLDDSYTVFHSVAYLVPSRKKRPPFDGEVDFVIAHPLHGILLRAIAHAWVDNIVDLRDLYGLDKELTRFVVETLQNIGHLLEGNDGRLALTPLGCASLATERRYEEFESRQVLYFEAYTSSPLPQRFHRLHFYSPGELEDSDRALYSFDPWRPEALDELLRRPDRDAYNVADKVQKLIDPDVRSAYLPMHIVDALRDDGQRVSLAFTNVRGRRDAFFDSLLDRCPEIVAPLQDDGRSPQEAIVRDDGWDCRSAGPLPERSQSNDRRRRQTSGALGHHPANPD